MLSKRSGAVNLSEKWREQLQERIKTIKNASEEVDRIAILCKNGLRRAPGGETLKFKNGFNVRVKSIGNGNFVEQTLQRLKIPFEDWSCNVVYHALTDEEDNPIVSLPKEMRGDIKKLYDTGDFEIMDEYKRVLTWDEYAEIFKSKYELDDPEWAQSHLTAPDEGSAIKVNYFKDSEGYEFTDRAFC